MRGFCLLALLCCCTSSALALRLLPAARMGQCAQVTRPRAAVAPVAVLPNDLPAALLAEGGDIVDVLKEFQDSHAFLIGIIVAIVSRLVISEVRRQVEKPVMDELGNKIATGLTPDTEAIPVSAWAKLAGCILMDLAGDASELIPVLGEFTDVGFAPVEAIALKALFQSNAIAGIGFVEEILPFTDVIPTFTLSWCLATLWPTTPIAQKLLPDTKRA